MLESLQFKAKFQEFILNQKTNLRMTEYDRKRKHEMGSVGNCVCSKCEMKLPHRRGVPCNEKGCPDCGVKMVREGLEHHFLLEKRKG